MNGFENLTEQEQEVLLNSGISNFDVSIWCDNEELISYYQDYSITAFCNYLVDCLKNDKPKYIINKSHFVNEVSTFFSQTEINKERIGANLKFTTIKNELIGALNNKIKNNEFNEFTLKNNYYKPTNKKELTEKLSGKLIKIL